VSVLFSVCVCVDVRAYSCVCLHGMHELLSVLTNNIYTYSCYYIRLSKCDLKHVIGLAKAW
jgi:hypothetical protein